MAVSLKHKFVTTKDDHEDSSLVSKTAWNDEHDLTLATDKLLGRASSGSGAVEEITCTAAGRAMLDDADAGAQRTTLGLGAAATLGKAAGADMRAGTSDDKALTTKAAYDAMAEVTLTDASTIAVDMTAGTDFVVTLGGNRTLGNPTVTGVIGKKGRIRIVHSDRTLAFGSNWEFAEGTAPDLSTGSSKTDILYYDVIASDRILGALVQDIS